MIFDILKNTGENVEKWSDLEAGKLGKLGI